MEAIVKEGSKSFGKAFLLYAIPLSLLKRRLDAKVFRRSLALGTFSGVAKVMKELLEWKGTGKAALYSKALAGASGSSAALLVDSSLTYNTLVFWVAIRALRNIMEETDIGKLVIGIPYISTGVMILSAAQIVTCWVRHPHELDSTYLKFLNSQGGRDIEVMKKFASPNPPLPATVVMAMARGPGVTYFQDAVTFFINGMKRGFKLYGPLYTLGLAYGLYKSDKKNMDLVRKLMRNFLSNTVFSSLFLTMYCWMAWMSWPLVKMTSTKEGYKKGATRYNLRKHCWLAGVATVFERKERRPELAHYCATYALDSIFTRMVNANPWLGTIQPYFASLFLVLSCSMLLHYDYKQPYLLRSWILGFSENSKPKSEKEQSNSIIK